MSDHALLGLKELKRTPHFIGSKAQTVVYTIGKLAHLTSTPPAPCSCVPATPTSLFHEHTCFRAFALAASPHRNAPPPESCRTISSLLHFQVTGKDIRYPAHFQLYLLPQHPPSPFPASNLFPQCTCQSLSVAFIYSCPLPCSRIHAPGDSGLDLLFMAVKFRISDMVSM